MGWLGYLCALVLAAVFVWAAAAKLARPKGTAAGFSALGLPAAHALAWAVPAAELVTAVLLVAVPRVGGLIALTVLAVFTAVLARALRRGAAVGCPCFGAISTKPVSWRGVMRNLALAVLAAAALWA